MVSVEIIKDDIMMLKHDIKAVKDQVHDLKHEQHKMGLTLADNRANIKLILSQLQVVNRMMEIQIKHGERIEVAAKDHGNLWTEVGSNRDAIKEVEKGVVANKSESGAIGKFVLAGPAWVITGIGLLVTVAYTAFQWSSDKQ